MTNFISEPSWPRGGPGDVIFALQFHDSARCTLNRDTFFPGSCAGVSCCLGVPGDSRTEDSTVGGYEDGRIGGAKDGESIIIMGD
jgi:hypothetical protein